MTLAACSNQFCITSQGHGEAAEGREFLKYYIEKLKLLSEQSIPELRSEQRGSLFPFHHIPLADPIHLDLIFVYMEDEKDIKGETQITLIYLSWTPYSL